MLLVEGYGDRIAALLVAERLGLEIDGEALAVVDCGGKAGIELIVGVRRALKIPFAVLHDEDVWPIDEAASPEAQKKTNDGNLAAAHMNSRIRTGVGVDAKLFILRPTLEEVLGIGRDAKDKPRRIVEELQKIEMQRASKELSPLVDAVRTICRKG